MPLNTQILRDGKHVHRSGNWWIVGAMMFTAAVDSGKGPFKNNSFRALEGRELPKADEWHNQDTCDDFKQDKDNPQICKGCGKAFPIVIDRALMLHINYGTLATTPLNYGRYTVKNGPYVFVDQSDGEIFTIQPGDILVAYRD